MTSNTFVNNSRLFGKVYFPRLVMPFATVLTEMINFAVQFVLFIAFVVIYAARPDSGVSPNWQLILLTPLMLIQLGLLGLYMLNPITPIIELFRAAYLGVPRYSYGYSLLSVGVTAVVFLLGVILFSRTEKTFMDTV